MKLIKLVQANKYWVANEISHVDVQSDRKDAKNVMRNANEILFPEQLAKCDEMTADRDLSQSLSSFIFIPYVTRPNTATGITT
ncbi:hypothetical protein L798_14404 [Zootermopsis nevadensis]|uniref:Uncharacterized protein n=1 Tax=Zootermopsis nevadensis TaxID=136037 RepID=A0A067R130_ZOONE|nr:hypothetical protein L798_14404 [Zootermopsis nevadensis]